MKYIVEVNAKFLISVEAETPLQAEHIVLEYDGIWGALAFDSDAMKTETFRGVVMSCETISMAELECMSRDYREAYTSKANTLDAYKAAQDEVERLEKLLADAKTAKANILKEVDAASNWIDEVNGKINFRKLY